MLAKSQTSVNPWLQHMEGMGNIIRLRGPEAHQSGIGHQIFIHYRANAVGIDIIPFSAVNLLTSQGLQAMMTRKSTFLSHPEWLSIPFQQEPKEIFHRFLDSVFPFAAVLESNDKVKICPTPNDTIRGRIAADCESIRAALVHWHESFAQLFPNRQYYAEMPSYSIVPEDYHSDTPVFPSYLQFPSLAVTQAMITYWYSPYSTFFL